MNNVIKRSIEAMFVTILLSLMTVALADDTDIINVSVPSDSNVLFIMDMSGSMSSELGSEDLAVAPIKSRKEVLHEALKTVLNSPELATTNIKVGLASFSGNLSVGVEGQTGHGISYPITLLTGDAETRLDSNPLWDHKTSIYDGQTITSHLPPAGLRTSIGYMGDAIPTLWSPYGATPMVDALYEGALYFRGSGVDLGVSDPSVVSSAHPSTYTGLVYNKTTTVDVPTLQTCGGTTGITCNATVDSCPTGTGSTSSLTCYTSHPTCATDAIAAGYSCGAPYTPIGSYTTSCDLATCSATAGCDTSLPSTSTTNHVCTLGSANACQIANPSYDPGSCSARVVPEGPRVCTKRNREGRCREWSSGTPEYTVYDCTSSSTSYACPYIPAERQDCTIGVPGLPVCTHTIQVPTTSTSLAGTANYKTPITEECSSNSIILLSDGEPTLNNVAVKVASLVGGLASGCDATPGTDDDIPHAGRCGKELTKFLANTDNNAAVSGDQFITTHTIGLSLDASPVSVAAKAYLEELAANGNGQFINASSPEGLVAALLAAITSTEPRARSFSSPTYTSSTDSLSHGNNVYVPVFDRSAGAVWSGNLKKYTRSGGRLVDADGVDATDSLGGLLATARDFWSAVPSIKPVLSGGVANKLPAPDNRTLYTDAGVAGGISFTAAHELKASNTSITKILLGDASLADAYRDRLISFIRGVGAEEITRNHIGDIIHSKPIFVEYAGSKRLYVGTNEGYLHAFDEDTGVEEFAFMPSTLLSNIKTQYLNEASTTHPYGVDGPITLQHNDANGDGIVNGADTAVLYFGLRRGGKAYYALDISDPSVPPILKWKIEQGIGDFSTLGYSWSQPVVMNMKHDATSPAEQVVVFGGGYVDDNGGEADNSGTGADVFIIKASDGSLVWKLSDLSNTTLTNAGVDVEYAIPGDIRVMDITGDTALDRLYFGDTGGNVWRVDFESHLTGTGAKKAKLKRFAELGGVAPKRKFFTEPDVAIFKAQGRYLISVAIGSGQRPKPLDATTDDNFFLMFDKDIRTAPTSATPTITKAILKDATRGPITGVLSGGFRGWFMDLVAINGEKVLSRATTYNNKILFNTLGVSSISAGAAGVCGPSNENQSRLYVVDLMDAGGVIDLDNDSTTDPADPADRSIPVAEGEIPGPPHIVMDEPSTCVQGDCVIKDSGGSGKGLDVPFTDSKILRRVYWIDK